MNREANYYLNKDGEFIIENYNLAKPFSSFFPGIAGLWGVPIWVFYVNRAQAIAGFGIKDKDHPIMEFNPANKAYQLTSSLGFRTLLKIHSGAKDVFYDAFASGINAIEFDIENKMFISSYDLKLKETNRTLGLEVGIEYFTIPNDNYGALARKLTIENISKHSLEIDCLDGLPQIIPFGLNNMFLKELSRTIEAWMDVENLEDKVPFFHLKTDPSDKPEVIHISEGNFYLAFTSDGLIKPIVDPQIIFGRVTDFTFPELFLRNRDFHIPQIQFAGSKTPCSMAYKNKILKAGASLSIYSLAGNIDRLKKLNANIKRIANEEYFNQKRTENRELIGDLQSCVFTHSASKQFNFYCGQNFLDNVLRGGYPLSLRKSAEVNSNLDNSGDIHIQVYSRKHGDLERDYNRFLIEPTYFSQGNGNFRDANQNRRSDVWFNPPLKDESIFTFFNLIQNDGYNPLVVKPDTFMFKGNFNSLNKFFKESEASRLKVRLQRPFTPGEIILFIEHNILDEKAQWDERGEFLLAVLSQSQRILNAEHSEGFWIDHWAYCLDLLEAYLGLYPEELQNILLEKKEFTFFDNSETVKPRSEKYVLKGRHVFQYHAVANNHAKSALIRKRECFPHFSRTNKGLGDVYKVSLITKMLVVIANKFASLDPFGVGVEMDANKPNWYDALNGLPALLGSSTSETFELKRWIVFLIDGSKKAIQDSNHKINIPVELKRLLLNLNVLSSKKLNDYDFWDKTHTLREEYIKDTLTGFRGEENPITVSELSLILRNFLNKINKGLKKAYSLKHKLYYSYFINEALDYKVLDDSDYLHFAKPLKFRQIPLPLFLEGIVHSLRVIDEKAEVKKIFEAVKRSELYDKKLKMYKVNASLLNMPQEIGRCRVFTPGWLENESIWLHMEYKYILELLKKGLYKEFFEDFKNVLIPFQNPKQYGRNILENSSFLVSSAFPDKKLHGNGFVARLSGSTAEFISIWLIMCAGYNPFYLDKDKKLCLEFKPILPSWLFSDREEGGFTKNTFAFKFLNKTLVVYHNPKRKDTFGVYKAAIKEITLEYLDKNRITFESSCLKFPYANDIRQGKVSRIDIFLI